MIFFCLNVLICKQSRLSQSNLFLSEIIIFLLSYFHILIIIIKKKKIRVLIQNPKIMEHRAVSVRYSIQFKRFSVQGQIVLTVGGGIRT